jgi:hypothetical protein
MDLMSVSASAAADGAEAQKQGRPGDASESAAGSGKAAGVAIAAAGATAASASFASPSTAAGGGHPEGWSSTGVAFNAEDALPDLDLGQERPVGMSGKLEETMAALDSLLGQMGEEPPPSGA